MISTYEARKILYPKMRRNGAVGITRNGGSKRVYSCVCGASDSMCAKWPMPKHTADFIARHERVCGARLCASAEAVLVRKDAT